jgi:uncharacterized DUF497 family protein
MRAGANKRTIGPLSEAARCNYNFVLRCEWDEQKNRTNRAKHGVSFETAQLVFEDPQALSIRDRHDNGEERWQTIGLAGGLVILLVAHTWRDDETCEEVVRIISARKATSIERRMYEQDDR